KKFTATFSFNGCLSIDKSTIPFKEKVAFKAYNLNKLAKHKIKVYICSNSKTDNTYKLKICSGISALVKTVTDLLTGLENKCREIFMDSFYNSFELCEKHQNQSSMSVAH
ncbi:hypothetical protein CDIK_4580, partial [Cucumispora dikerogammari]